MESNPVEEFQSAFQGCLTACTNQEYLNQHSVEELKSSIDLSVQKYLEVARRLETFFLQQRLALSINKPEQLIREDINEMKQEIQRKDALIQKHSEQLQKWMKVLNQPMDNSGLGTSGTSQAAPNAMQQQPNPTAGGVQSQVQHPSQGVQQNVTGATGQQVSSQHPQPSQQGTQNPGGYNQNPLAFLEKTTSNIGIGMEPRRNH